MAYEGCCEEAAGEDSRGGVNRGRVITGGVKDGRRVTFVIMGEYISQMGSLR